MKKVSIICVIAALCVALTYGIAGAVVQGACVNCHTMHNSQDGAVVVAGGPYQTLLKGDCIGCHGLGPGAIVTNTPQVLHSTGNDLAGGNFGYITGIKTKDAADPGATLSTVGHNVIDLGAFNEATIPNLAANYPPGDEFGNYAAGLTRTTFTCAGTMGCHGDRTISGSMAAVRGSHHVNDGVLKFGTISEAGQGGTTALSYRFLKGVKGGENPTWQDTVSATVHNEYKGAAAGVEGSISAPGGNTINGLCAECHGNFHGTAADIGTGPWLRHPTDIVLPSTVTKEYQYYNGSAGGGASGPYSLDAPVARATIPIAASSGTVTPGTNDSIVMCLSCHKVHGSANADILRWNYSTINAGGGSNTTRCFICHTTKDTGS